jgi:hypothetical protein
LGKPRKIVKKCHPTKLKNEEVTEYSKIPSIPEVRLTVDEMKSDPIELLVAL